MHALTQPHEFAKIISEFSLEYRTIRQRVFEQKKKKENMKKRTKTRGKLITEVFSHCRLYVILASTSSLSFSQNKVRYQCKYLVSNFE